MAFYGTRNLSSPLALLPRRTNFPERARRARFAFRLCDCRLVSPARNSPRAGHGGGLKESGGGMRRTRLVEWVVRLARAARLAPPADEDCPIDPSLLPIDLAAAPMPFADAFK